MAQEKLELIRPHQSIVKELKDAIKLATTISNLLKIKGLSTESVKDAIKEIDKELKKTEVSEPMKIFANYLKEYMDKYQNFINLEQWEGKTIPVCSDIIERLFGIYKGKVSDNYFVAATTVALELPLMCLSREELTQNIQKILEEVSMTNLKEWRKIQNSDNQFVMRAKFFKKQTVF